MSSDSHGYMQSYDYYHSSRKQSVDARSYRDKSHIRFHPDSTYKGSARGKSVETHANSGRTRNSRGTTSLSLPPSRLDGSADITESRTRSPPASPTLQSGIPLAELQERKKYEINDETEDEEGGILAPGTYREGILGSILKLRDEPANDDSSSSLPCLIGLSPTGSHDHSEQNSSSRSWSTNAIGARVGRKKGSKMEETIIPIRLQIQETLARQKYLLRLCGALMKYGAPTHRLEECMRMSARVLEVDSQFLYSPGCMIISFDDQSTHTTEVKIVRINQGIDFTKLHDTHHIYKEVIRDQLSVEDALNQLDEIRQRKPQYGPYRNVLYHGLASAFVGPLGFQGQWKDIPIAFVLGCILGIMQTIMVSRSERYANVFEISVAIVNSFLARAFGSIGGKGMFCFSSLVQSSIANVFPGYMILSSALELQSRSIVAGSVRLVYAIIYSLFLGFGVTVGITLYGAIDKNAASEVSCIRPITGYWTFLFVLPYTACMIVSSQGKRGQVLAMLFIAFAGYVVVYYSTERFLSAQISNALGAFAVGTLGNLYSRYFQILPTTVLIPAIYILVPSGLASTGSLISGITTANQVTNPTGEGQGTGGTMDIDIDHVIFNVAYSMIQVAIATTVGLCLSSLVTYPSGKKRSGLFNF